MKEILNNPSMEAPAIYRVRIEGNIDPKWSTRLEGMNITSSLGEAGQTESILVGRLADQSALAGILHTLYEMHRPVLSVECLEAG